jgi:UDP-2,3-diacylglucosamine hydrolase
VLGTTVVTVADAHLGAAPPGATDAFLRFVEAVPSLGDALLINGDLFDFWFCYRHVMPRHGFRVAAALAELRKRVPIAIVGGNHDRWGDDFWERDLGAVYHPRELRFSIGRRETLAIHGDGLTDTRASARVLNAILGSDTALALFRMLHPDAAHRLVLRLQPLIGENDRGSEARARAFGQQEAWARSRLGQEPGIGLVIMAHTHQAAVAQLAPGQQYLNPGAWFDGFRYAIATETGAELHSFTG